MITKLLCKYLDVSGKGYVTIGDLIVGTVALACAASVVLLYIQGAIYSISLGFLPVKGVTFYEGISHAVFIGITAPLALIVVALIVRSLYEVVVSALHIKIVKCERKDEES